MLKINQLNKWYFSSLLISIFVAIPIITVFISFFETTGNYSSILKETFLYEYISNSIFLWPRVLFRFKRGLSKIVYVSISLSDVLITANSIY